MYVLPLRMMPESLPMSPLARAYGPPASELPACEAYGPMRLSYASVRKPDGSVMLVLLNSAFGHGPPGMRWTASSIRRTESPLVPEALSTQQAGSVACGVHTTAKVPPAYPSER